MALKILLVEPYFTGSHKRWAEDFSRRSRHEVHLLTMEGRFWKWRMHGGAVSLARRFNGLKFQPDLILTTDMLDLTTFLALTRDRTADIPAALYFHENQITYPWSPDDRDIQKARNHHYGFINFASALTAKAVFFNSIYHRDSFLAELPRFLGHFPDYRELDSVNKIAGKSSVLYVGLDFDRIEKQRPNKRRRKGPPVILWNHRWEYDKNPVDFFIALAALNRLGLDFRVVILGENFKQKPGIFEKAKTLLGAKVIHFGYCPDFADYTRWLYASDILPVTSNQDFFGISILEAAYCGVLPLLPRRLTYPELFPEDKFPDLFYADLDDLTAKLQDILTGNNIIHRPEIADRTRMYSWDGMIGRYDEVLQELAGRKTGCP